MKFSYNWLKKYVDIKLSPDKLAELLTLHSFETVALNKNILDVDVLPNRAHDCLSYYGLAKEIGVLTGKPVKILKTDFKKSADLKSANLLKVDIKEKVLCLRYEARVLTNVKIGPSPKWLAEALKEFNIKPHNNIVDILNYVMLEMGQPMHAFDYDKIAGEKIVVRRAKNGEKINTLDGGKYDLNENILVIADSEKPVAVAGIKGGLETGVSDNTKTIVVESANFEGSGIRRTSRALKLSTDAAIRFSYGFDPNLTEFGLNRVCALIQEISPGIKISATTVDVYLKKFLPRKIKLDLAYLNNLIGENIKPEFVRKTLTSLGCFIRGGKNSFLVTAPTARLDLEREEDLIEEVARIFGLANLKSAMPMAALSLPKPNDINIFSNKIRDILTGLGFSETYNYSLIKEGDVEIQNPISEDYKYLRPELFYGLLKNVKSNFRFFGNIKLFEIGKIFSAKDGHAPIEKFDLAGVSAIKDNKEKINGERFFEMKGDLDVLFEKIGISDCYYDSVASDKKWHSGRVAEIKHGEDLIGTVGEISPALLGVWDISGRVVMFNLDLTKLIEIAEEEREFLPISKYPAVIRDIAVLVDKETRVSEVLDVIYSSGIDLVSDVDLFDYYDPSTGSGQELAEGKKSLAFHIIYEADHTLTDEEVRREEGKIKNALIKELNAEIR